MNSLLTLAAAGSPSSMQLIIASVLGVALILYLIIVIKLHAFVTLLLVSFLVGLGAGMPITSKTTIKVVLKGYTAPDVSSAQTADEIKARNESIEEHFKAVFDFKKPAGDHKKGDLRGPFHIDTADKTILVEHILEVNEDHLVVDLDLDAEKVVESKIEYSALTSSSTLVGFTKKGIIDTVKGGMGGILGFVAIVVGLGAMFGKMLEISGGAERLAKNILEKFGDDKAPWALGLTGFLISIPVFLDVGLIIIIPIVYSLAHRTGKPLLYYGIPLLAGLGVTHAMIPPTPGPIAVADLLGADLGWVILFGCIAGLPAMVIAGPIFGRYISKKVTIGIPDFVDFEEPDEGKPLPSFGLVMFLILTPLVLILASTIIGYTSIPAPYSTVVKFLGDPFVAMLIATILSFYTLGKFCGYSREEVQDIATKALEPAGIIILVTGAGGVFKQVLIDSGVGQMLGQMMKGSTMSPVLLAFIIAMLVRVAQGSATVAMVTGGGIMAGIISGAGMTPSGPLLGLIAIAIACGSTVFSHVNDSGFWLVNRFFGMTVKETLKTWTMVETIIGFVGFGVVYTISLFIN
ncbi:MAG: GntP family permease [Lentisphaerales bacterium]|nr:GntP family permease [Lentisphaerales bacterium]